MRHSERLRLLGLSPKATSRDISTAADKLGFDAARLEELLHPLKRPLNFEVEKLAQAIGRPQDEVRIVFGAIDRSLHERIGAIAMRVAEELEPRPVSKPAPNPPAPAFRTDLGELYRADCLDVLKSIAADSIDLVFADPPFNLNKAYESGIDDDLAEKDYLTWCEEWIDECCRVLRPGGTLFVWNIPKWCTHLAGMLDPRLTFRHWIAVDIKYSLPISKRLYPSHYGLLYYTKGKSPTTFAPDRLAMADLPFVRD